LSTRNSRSDRLSLDSEALGELRFWHFNLKELDSQPMWRQPDAVRIVYSDASDTGYGGYTVSMVTCCSGIHWNPNRTLLGESLCAARLVLQSLDV